jgi:hypothetical protein
MRKNNRKVAKKVEKEGYVKVVKRLTEDNKKEYGKLKKNIQVRTTKTKRASNIGMLKGTNMVLRFINNIIG